MRFLTTLYVIAISFAIPVFSQSVISIIDIANDPNLNETEPYLTYYWYSGFFECITRSVSNGISPLWLVYKETDIDSNSRIVGYNFDFDIDHNIAISDKYPISGLPTTSKKFNPIIENYLGKPVAIWVEEVSGQSNLKYSILNAYEWTPPQKITDNSSLESNPIFFTEDAWSLENQVVENNYLFWTDDTTIVAASLDASFNWSAPDTIFSGSN